MTTIYVVGSTNDELIKGLCDPGPSERAKSAEAIGLLHVYQALPFLLDTARTAPDEGCAHYRAAGCRRPHAVRRCGTACHRG